MVSVYALKRYAGQSPLLWRQPDEARESENWLCLVDAFRNKCIEFDVDLQYVQAVFEFFRIRLIE